MLSMAMTAEQLRLTDARNQKAPWTKWGPYLAERQWGTVREDYSDDGNAWNDFSHEQARSRAYRWGEDGLAGVSDDKQLVCFALALWNGKDPVLKERLFGLTNSEGNHGEDVKEYYFYLDSARTQSYRKYVWIGSGMMNAGGGTGMWDEEDGFFYDVLRLPDGQATRLKVRSMVGLLPLCAATVFDGKFLVKHPELANRLHAFLVARKELREAIHDPVAKGVGGSRLASVLSERRLRRVLEKMLDEREFLSPYGILRKDGRRPVHGGTAKFQDDPHWRDLVLFYEYFHGDNGAGLGASHQTGWTAVVARAMHLFATTTPEQVLELGKLAVAANAEPAMLT
jgi:hypothetical protein